MSVAMSTVRRRASRGEACARPRGEALAGLCSRWGIAPLLALMIVAVLLVPAAEAAPAPKQMRGACAKKSSGQLRYVARSSQCRRSADRPIRFSAAKTRVACARRGAGVYVVGKAAACSRGANRPSLMLELPSAEKHDFCAHKRTGMLRSTDHVPYPDQ